MTSNLTGALASALPAEVATRALRVLGGGSRAKSRRHGGPPAHIPADKPILQLNDIPVTLNPDNFKNAYSRQNPDGDQRASYAFRKLVDPVPVFSRVYSASGRSIEKTYRNLVEYASVHDNHEMAAGMIATAKKEFSDTAVYVLAGSGKFRLVGAMPNDWYDVTQVQRFQKVDLDLAGPENADSSFTVLSGSDSPQLRVGDNPERPDVTTKLHTGTKIWLKLKALTVTIERPWLDFELFHVRGWFLQGQPGGYHSSGRIDINQGVLPLLTTALVVGINVEAKVDAAGEDHDLVERAVKENKSFSVGPFPVEAVRMVRGNKELLSSTSTAGGAAPVLHVIGWISSLVPLAPQDTEPGLPP